MIFNNLSEALFLSREQLDSTVPKASESSFQPGEIWLWGDSAAQPAEPSPTPER